jgi:hypothetical protein
MTRTPRFLALDIAKCTGYALVEGDRLIRSGVRDFSSEHIGRRGLKFYNFLLSIGHVDEIYFETIMFGGNFKNAAGKWVAPSSDGRELYHGLLMVMNMYAAGYGVHPFPVHPSTLKKNFTGHGHAEKKDMCAAARALGWQGGAEGSAAFHDEVDAIAMLVTELKARYNITVQFPLSNQ